jgi:hypothetical protein
MRAGIGEGLALALAERELMGEMAYESDDADNSNITPGLYNAATPLSFSVQSVCTCLSVVVFRFTPIRKI